jgi:hypothetical protein
VEDNGIGFDGNICADLSTLSALSRESSMKEPVWPGDLQEDRRSPRRKHNRSEHAGAGDDLLYYTSLSANERGDETMTQRGTSITILIADDDIEDRMMVVDAFAESHLANPLRFVENGEQLMDYLSAYSYVDPATAPRPGLMLDLNMPKKDGRRHRRNKERSW